MTKEVIKELRKYTLGKKNTEKVEISVLQLNRIIKVLGQVPTKFAVSPERIAIIENELEELFERVESIEKLIREDKEEQLKKLKADLDYAKFCCVLYDRK